MARLTVPACSVGSVSSVWALTMGPKESSSSWYCAVSSEEPSDTSCTFVTLLYCAG